MVDLHARVTLEKEAWHISCKRHAMAIAQIKQIKQNPKRAQVGDSQRHRVWWRRLTATGLYRLALTWSKALSSLVVALCPRRRSTVPPGNTKCVSAI